VQRLVEDDLFDLESYSIRGEFTAKARTCRFYFNLVWANSHKENQILSPFTTWIAHRSALELCLLP
jgi:outer membrane biogenesis lipoprotein LolB